MDKLHRIQKEVAARDRACRALIGCAAAALVAVLAVAALSYRLFVIASPSMEPQYKAGALVVIQKTPFERVQTGDVIAYRSEAINGQTAFHRVIAVEEDGLITKGDNSETIDGVPVTESTYVGTAVFSTDRLAGAVRFFRSGHFRLLLAVCVSGTLSVLFLTRKRAA